MLSQRGIWIEAWLVVGAVELGSIDILVFGVCLFVVNVLVWFACICIVDCAMF